MHNVINKKSIIFFSIAIIVILLSSYLRIYQINKTYSEYDENFMIALHKSAIEDKEVSLNIGPIKKKN